MPALIISLYLVIALIIFIVMAAWDEAKKGKGKFWDNGDVVIGTIVISVCWILVIPVGLLFGIFYGLYRLLLFIFREILNPNDNVPHES